MILFLKKLKLDRKFISKKKKDKIDLQSFKSRIDNQIRVVINDKNQNCRVCFSKQTTSDPFLDLCKCCKSNPVHLSCIRKWL